MDELETIAEHARADFEARTHVRDGALAQARSLIRYASRAIRAVHRDEKDVALDKLAETANLADQLKDILDTYPDIYFAGYTQDALKEFAEARIVFALVYGGEFPTAEGLNIPYNTYLKGLAEAATEMRRRCLDLMRENSPDAAKPVLGMMEDIYAILVTMDYPDAITGGLRRQTDIVRGVLERTRGDLTVSLRQQHLEESLRKLESRLDGEG